MNELIVLIRRVLTLASGGRVPGPKSTAGGRRLAADRTSHSRADFSNGIRWSDVVTDIESERVKPST